MKAINNFFKGLQKNVRIRSTLYLVFLLGLTVGIVVKVALVYGVDYNVTTGLSNISNPQANPQSSPAQNEAVAPMFSGLLITDDGTKKNFGITSGGSAYSIGTFKSKLSTTTAADAVIAGENTATGPNVVGVAGKAKYGIGVQGESEAADGYAMKAINTAGVGLYGETNGTTANMAGVFGKSKNAAGTQVHGVYGFSQGGNGVYGVTSGTSASVAGVYAKGSGTTVPAIIAEGHEFIKNGNLEFQGTPPNTNFLIRSNIHPIYLDATSVGTTGLFNIGGVSVMNGESQLKGGAKFLDNKPVYFTEAGDVNFSCSTQDCRIVDFSKVKVVGLEVSGNGTPDPDPIFNTITVKNAVNLNTVGGLTKIGADKIVLNPNGDLTVSGITKLVKNVDIGGGKITLSQAGDLMVSNNTNLKTLNLTGRATINQGMKILGAANNSAQSVDFTQAGDVNFTCSTQDCRKVDFTKVKVVGLEASGNGTPDPNPTFDTITVKGNSSLNTQSGTTTIGSNKIVLNSNGDLTVSNNTNLKNLSVSGTSTFTGTSNLNGTNNMNGQSNFNNNVKFASGKEVNFTGANVKGLDPKMLAQVLSQQIYVSTDSANGSVSLKCNGSDVLLSCNGKANGYALEMASVNSAGDSCLVKSLNSQGLVSAQVICLKLN